MAKAPNVKIDGNDQANVLEVQFGVRAAVDRDGAPTRGLECDGIMIRRVCDDSVDVAEWAADPTEANRKSGEITFMDNNGLEMKKLTWSGAYVRNYTVDYSIEGDHVEETFIVEPETIGVGGEDHFFDWKNK